MSLLHYFSKDEDKRARFIFNLIAPIYGYLVKVIEPRYRVAMASILEHIDVKGKEVLDLGAGTGVWGYMFYRNGAKRVVAVDFAEKMVVVGKRIYPELEFVHCNAQQLSKFDDNSFDIVTASYVMHGMKADKRRLVLEQAKRVSRRYVVFHDFLGKVRFYVAVLEALERSDYKNFVKSFCDEMASVFGNCKKVATATESGIYIAEV